MEDRGGAGAVRLLVGVALAVPLLALASKHTRVAAQGRADWRSAALEEPFRGVTSDGTPLPGLFAIRQTGVSTQPVVVAARRFLASLSEAQRGGTQFSADAIEWRRWDNVHRAPRAGIRFGEMDAAQQDAALGLLGAGLSARGLAKARGVMRLNQHLAELVTNFEEYGEGLYHLTVMGEPSESEPWGWQLDGHHLAINYFVLGDQVVMTPSFMGSEPVVARSGRYAGTSVMQPEQDRGLALMRALDAAQQERARLAPEKTRNDAQAQAYQDNLVLSYQGIPASALDAGQRRLLLDLIGEYTGNLAPGHAGVWIQEVEAHLDQTRFAWIGGSDPEAVFYYRIHSPVILIEFDHQSPVALEGPRVPSRRHVHSVVRTPNGNDYGTDLLRQHYAAHAGDSAHGHAPGARFPE